MYNYKEVNNMQRFLFSILIGIFILGLTYFCPATVSADAGITLTDLGGYLGYGIMPRAIYIYSKDTKVKSVVPKNLLKTYLPLTDLGTNFDNKKITLKTLKVEDGIDHKNLSQIKVTGGKLQLCYKGKPLYLYSGDQSPSDTNGNGQNGFSLAKL